MVHVWLESTYKHIHAFAGNCVLLYGKLYAYKHTYIHVCVQAHPDAAKQALAEIRGRLIESHMHIYVDMYICICFAGNDALFHRKLHI
jgi:hypothetical protein